MSSLANEAQRSNKKHAKVEFKHQGAKCPGCGWVYKEGFSDVTKAVVGRDIKPPNERKTAFSVCTGCYAPMRVDMTTGVIELISEAEKLFWPTEMHTQVADIIEQLKRYRASMPS